MKTDPADRGQTWALGWSLLRQAVHHASWAICQDGGPAWKGCYGYPRYHISGPSGMQCANGQPWPERDWAASVKAMEAWRPCIDGRLVPASLGWYSLDKVCPTHTNEDGDWAAGAIAILFNLEGWQMHITIAFCGEWICRSEMERLLKVAADSLRSSSAATDLAG